MAPDLNLEIPAVTADWAVCIKPVGMECERELPAALSARIGGTLFPVHRLDLNVGGLVVFARTRSAAAELSRHRRLRCRFRSLSRMPSVTRQDTRQSRILMSTPKP